MTKGTSALVAAEKQTRDSSKLLIRNTKSRSKVPSWTKSKSGGIRLLAGA